METKNEEIDLIEVAKTLWANKLKIIKYGAVGFLIGVVVAYSIPKEFSSVAKFAPENDTKNMSGSMGSLASLVGMGNMNLNEGISDNLYPEIISSTPFL